MSGIDDAIARLAGGSIPLGLLVALLLGLRHATDPDHLTAVSTLVLGDSRYGARSAGMLGLCWGLGHASTLFAFGLPVVLFRHYLPEPAQAAAEAAIGILIIGLAVRLLVRWRLGHLHTDSRTHGALEHSHPHMHVGHRRTSGRASSVAPEHGHSHRDTVGRSPAAAFGIGLVHGVGGSAGVGVLLVTALPGPVPGAVALLLFAAATALSMALVSWSVGYTLTWRRVTPRLAAVTPLLGCLSLVFGVWYMLGGVRAIAAAL